MQATFTGNTSKCYWSCKEYLMAETLKINAPFLLLIPRKDDVRTNKISQQYTNTFYSWTDLQKLLRIPRQIIGVKHVLAISRSYI